MIETALIGSTHRGNCFCRYKLPNKLPKATSKSGFSWFLSALLQFVLSIRVPLLLPTVVGLTAEEFNTSDRVLSTMPTDYFAQITQQFVDARFAPTGKIGKAQSVLLSAKEFVGFAIATMEREFGTTSIE
ncbi:MAG: hypothetical protein WA885_07715 [Phormidesmis sp.]